MHDWRKAVRTPISYSVPGASSTLLRQQTNFVTAVVLTGTLILLTLYILAPDITSNTASSRSLLAEEHGHHHESTRSASSSDSLDCKCSSNLEGRSSGGVYNATYPLTPVERLSDGRLRFHIAAVADLDTRSRAAGRKDRWNSFLLRGLLTYDPARSSIEISWSEEEEALASSFAAGGRGAELSELVVFNGRLLTCDDRTGIVYEVVNQKTQSSSASAASATSSSNSSKAKWNLLPWVILRDGDGHSSSSGFKCEWMAVKDSHLYVGSLGKEWTTSSGEPISGKGADRAQWVKRISTDGAVEHLDWRPAYAALVRAAGIISPPGYLIHEAAIFSPRKRKNSVGQGRWHFLPRRASHESYNEQADERRAANMVLSGNPNLTQVNLTLSSVGRLSHTHGFSSVKLLPLPDNGEEEPEEIVLALKSEESGSTVASYVTAFRLSDGRVLLPETQMSAVHKYEGVEFI